MADIVFLGSNDVGDMVYDWLIDETDDDVRALLTEREQLDVIERLKPDYVISAGFRYLVPEEILAVPEAGAVNLHLSYLPYNRGMNPNVWGILEERPAGTTIHHMTPEFDTGSIIDRRRVDVYPDDTGKTLYDRLCRTQIEQFKTVWPRLRDGDIDPIPQDSDEGTYHRQEEFIDLWKIDRDEQVRAGDLIDRLRALTFPPFKNAYFEADGERYYLELDITPESEHSDETADNIPAYEES